MQFFAFCYRFFYWWRNFFQWRKGGDELSSGENKGAKTFLPETKGAETSIGRKKGSRNFLYRGKILKTRVPINFLPVPYSQTVYCAQAYVCTLSFRSTSAYVFAIVIITRCLLIIIRTTWATIPNSQNLQIQKLIARMARIKVNGAYGAYKWRV